METEIFILIALHFRFCRRRRRRYYLRQGGYVCTYASLFVCQEDYGEATGPIEMKLCGGMWHGSRLKRFNSRADPVNGGFYFYKFMLFQMN